MIKKDYIIVGQGLAGSVLALCLLKQGKTIAIVDNGHKNSSSIVAAGMWNPIVFRRITKSWMADELLPEMNSFYRDTEELINTKFYFNKNLARIHASLDEVNLWVEKTGLPGFQPYLSLEEDAEIDKAPLEMKNGYGIVKNSGYLDLAVFLKSCKDYFVQNGMLEENEFPIDELYPESARFHSNNFISEHIIFCDGYRGSQNPFFAHIPYAPAKGEVITINAENLNVDNIINAGFFILPLGNHKYKVGATFDWEFETECTTAEAKEILSDKLKNIIQCDFEVIDQKAGIRPTVQDRRPLLGTHPVYKNIHIFNGLGTKGVMIAPYFAKHFTEYLTGNNELIKEVNINRFDKFLGQKNVQINHP